MLMSCCKLLSANVMRGVHSQSPRPSSPVSLPAGSGGDGSPCRGEGESPDEEGVGMGRTRAVAVVSLLLLLPWQMASGWGR